MQTFKVNKTKNSTRKLFSRKSFANNRKKFTARRKYKNYGTYKRRNNKNVNYNINLDNDVFKNIKTMDRADALALMRDVQPLERCRPLVNYLKRFTGNTILQDDHVLSPVDKLNLIELLTHYIRQVRTQFEVKNQDELDIMIKEKAYFNTNKDLGSKFSNVYVKNGSVYEPKPMESSNLVCEDGYTVNGYVIKIENCSDATVTILRGQTSLYAQLGELQNLQYLEIQNSEKMPTILAKANDKQMYQFYYFMNEFKEVKNVGSMINYNASDKLQLRASADNNIQQNFENQLELNNIKQTSTEQSPEIRISLKFNENCSPKITITQLLTVQIKDAQNIPMSLIRSTVQLFKKYRITQLDRKAMMEFLKFLSKHPGVDIYDTISLEDFRNMKNWYHILRIIKTLYNDSTVQTL
jgi:hypothetical protein